MESFDPHSSATTGYHLFFLPQGALAEQLSAIIKQLAEENGGPVFPPHITLLARVPDTDEEELIEKTRRLAAQMQPLSLTLGTLRSEDSYFRALYSEISEQDALRALHEQASSVFGMEKDPAYEGHLSLLYGNYPEEQKAQTRESLALPEGPSFIADTLHLFKTPGTTDTWRQIISAPLNG